jgi:hypothetical protein
MDNCFATYYEELLRAQYKVSEEIQQKLPRGTIREDFLRDLVLKRRENLRGKKGIVSKGGTQSGECDLIFYEASATVNPIGDQILIEPEHCKLVLEIKSNATGKDLKKSNKNFQKIKELDSENKPMCGLFCYNTVLKKETIFNRFGWIFDKETESWKDDPGKPLKYLSIDFIVCIACLDVEECMEKQFFLIKDNSSQRHILKPEYPIINNFFGITDNL